MTDLDLIDELSRRLNDKVREKEREFNEAEQKGMRNLLETNPFMKKDVERAGLTIEQYSTQANEDAPFSEGRSGLRSFLAQSYKVAISTAIDHYGLSPQRTMLRDWFQHGRFSKLSPEAKSFILSLAKRESEPITIYREQSKLPEGTEPDSIAFRSRVPRPWSSHDKPMMGSVTFILPECSVGTEVSFLSQYPGEMEHVAVFPRGLVIESIEERRWGTYPKPRLRVTLREPTTGL